MRKLYTKLTEEGFDIWLDEAKLVGGQDWQMEILKAVRSSHIVLVCLSKNAVSKVGFVQKEIKYALDVALEHPEDDIFIIPLRFENCNVPERLKQWHWIDLYKPDGYEQLLFSLELRENNL